MVRAGAENQLEGLVKFMDRSRVQIVKCVVTDHKLFDEDMAKRIGVPVVMGGRDELRAAMQEADVLLCWGGNLGQWLVDVRPKLTVFIAHGESHWTRQSLDGCMPLVNHVVAVSERVKELTCQGHATTVIPNGVDLARIAPTMSRAAKRTQLGFTNNDVVLTYIGRFSDEKHPDAVVQATALLPDRYKALLVGWGDGEQDLRELAEKAIPGRYRFCLAKDDVGDYLQAADAVVLCSKEEGFSLVLLEAMFHEKPLIVTPVGSVPELQAKGDFFWVTDGSPQEVARHALEIGEWLKEADGDTLVRVYDAHAYAQEHGYARRMAEKYTDLIERLLAEKQAKNAPSILSSRKAEAVPRCAHMQDVTGETVACQTCRGSVKLKVFGCKLHDRCNPHKQLPGVVYCPACPDNTMKAKEDRPVDERVAKAYAEARKMKWAYGVTTVPSRFNDLLPRTLESLELAGFDAPRLFVDGDTDSNDWGRLQYEKTFRYPPLRTHGNWWLALHELYIRNPNADLYAIFQDDMVTYRNLRSYLEATSYPDKGYLNLYTVQQNLDLCPPGNKGFYLSNQMGRGALALVFDNAACVALLSSNHMVQRAKDPIRGHKVVDGGIVTALGQAGFREYVHNPSLVYHTGEVSTLGKPVPSPQAANFVGEDFDALQLLRPEKVVQV